jgi:hypothetical protein
MGSSIQVGDGEEIASDVGASMQSRQEGTDAIDGIADAVVERRKKFKPSNSSIEFGVEFWVKRAEAKKPPDWLVRGQIQEIYSVFRVD